jgi:hypothetical protein
MRARFKSLNPMFLRSGLLGTVVLTSILYPVLVQDDGGNVRLHLEMLPRMLG